MESLDLSSQKKKETLVSESPIKKSALKTPNKKLKALVQKKTKGEKMLKEAREEKSGIMEEEKQSIENYGSELEKIQKRKQKIFNNILGLKQQEQEIMSGTQKLGENEIERTQERYSELINRRREIFDKIVPAERKKLINSSGVGGSLLEGIMKLGDAFFMSDTFYGESKNPFSGENSFLAMHEKAIEEDYIDQKRKNSELGEMLKLYEKEIGDEKAVLDEYKLEQLSMLKSQLEYAEATELNEQQKEKYLQAKMGVEQSINQIKHNQNSIAITEAEEQVRQETNQAMLEAERRAKQAEFNMDMYKEQLKNENKKEQELIKGQNMKELEEMKIAGRKEVEEMKIAGQKELEETKAEAKAKKEGSGFSLSKPYKIGGKEFVATFTPKDKKLINSIADAEVNATSSIKNSVNLVQNLNKFSGKYLKTLGAKLTPAKLGTENVQDFRQLKAGLEKIKTMYRIELTGGGNISDKEQEMLKRIAGATDEDIFSGTTKRLLTDLYNAGKERYKAELMTKMNMTGVTDVREKEKIVSAVADGIFLPIFKALKSEG